MKTIAIANQKGGVGKTPLALHVAHRALEKGLRVLLVDMDNQGSLSLSFPPSAESGRGPHLQASHLFDTEQYLTPEAITSHLSIVRADNRLLTIDKAENEVIRHPREALRKYAGDFDLVVIDTPPSLGLRLMAALSAADGVVTPLTIGFFELAGAGDLLSTIHVVRTQGFNQRLRHIGIQIMRNNDRSMEDKQAIADLRERYGRLVLPDELPQRQTVTKAIMQQLPVWKLPTANLTRSPQKPSIADTWRSACDNIIERGMK